MGCRKIVAGLVAVAPLLLLNQVNHAKAAPSGDAQWMNCGLSRTADHFGSVDDGYTGDGEPVRREPADRQSCGRTTAEKDPQSGDTVFFTPILQDHDDLEDDTTVPVRHLTRHRAAAAPAI